MTDIFGVFGGTFDPPHVGHLILAGEAMHQLQLNRVLWVLTPQPPHKPDQPITPLYHRIEMLKRAIGNSPGFEFSNVEIERPGPHYSLDTLDILQTRHPRSPLVMLIGGDSLRDLPTWHHPEELVTAVYAFGVMRRPGSEILLGDLYEKLPALKSKVRFFDTPELEISSSAIRERVAAGGHFRYYLPPGVYEYIVQNRLYR